MATPALNSRVQSLVTEYGVFWQFWPQFEQTHGERRLVGFEVELIGSHTSDPTTRSLVSGLPPREVGIACDRGPHAWRAHPQRKFPHLPYTILTQIHYLYACFRQSLGGVGKYLRFLGTGQNGQSIEMDLFERSQDLFI
jgi:hypothetical protein